MLFRLRAVRVLCSGCLMLLMLSALDAQALGKGGLNQTRGAVLATAGIAAAQGRLVGSYAWPAEAVARKVQQAIQQPVRLPAAVTATPRRP